VVGPPMNPAKEAAPHSRRAQRTRAAGPLRAAVWVAVQVATGPDSSEAEVAGWGTLDRTRAEAELKVEVSEKASMAETWAAVVDSSYREEAGLEG
jgi:hypothetical protein